MNDEPVNSDQSDYTLMHVTGFWAQTWLFRAAIVLTVFLTVAMCNFLFKDTGTPLSDALPVMLGLVLGFGVLHLVESGARKATH